MSTLRDWEVINAQLNRGFLRDRSRDLSGERADKPNRHKTYSRCPICGGMVVMPCLLCNPEQFEELSDIKTKKDYNAQH